MKLFLLAVLWVAWCTLHSLLISQPVTQWAQKRLGEKYRFYRVWFNVLALATLLPVVVYGGRLEGAPILQWQGAWVIPQIVLLLFSLFLFAAGASKYDLSQFMGLDQIRTGNSHAVLSRSGRLDTGGILKVTRHPWYLGGILIVWTYQPEIDAQSLVTNTVLTLYFIVGAILEETKLVSQFGEEYREYQGRVSMLFPVKWLKSVRRR